MEKEGGEKNKITFPFTPYLVLWCTKLTGTARQVTVNKNILFISGLFFFEWIVCSSIQPLNTLNHSQRSLNAGLCITGICHRSRMYESYFFAKEIFIALLCVILKPCKASLAAPACTSLSNSTKAMSWRPGTRRTSLNPGNLGEESDIVISKRRSYVLKLLNWTRFKRGVKANKYSLVEQHGQHELVGLLWEIGEKQDVVGRVFRHLQTKWMLLIKSQTKYRAFILILVHTCCGIWPGICPGIIWPGGMAPGGICPGAMPGGGIIPGGGM